MQRNPAPVEDAVMALLSPEHTSFGSSWSNQDALFLLNYSRWFLRDQIYTL